MSRIGTGQRRLTISSALDVNPAWSPDGQRIVFQSSRDGNSEIYVMNNDGSAQTRLTSTSGVENRVPDWQTRPGS
jgi:TolB protein